MFATCSDDTTVALWDTRYMKHNIRTLRGHSNWVKNIEYASNMEKLVTSGFDGSIYTWDINKSVICLKLFISAMCVFQVENRMLDYLVKNANFVA